MPVVIHHLSFVYLSLLIRKIRLIFRLSGLIPLLPRLDTRPQIIQPDPTCTVSRRQRHSISGQTSYFKLLDYSVSKKLTGSANSLFSTAVISGSSSAPNLKDMVPPHASAVAGKYWRSTVLLAVYPSINTANNPIHRLLLTRLIALN